VLYLRCAPVLASGSPVDEFPHRRHERSGAKRPEFLSKLKLNGWSRARRVVVQRTLKPIGPSPPGIFRKPFEEDFAS
jgi:hypothetical protein